MTPALATRLAPSQTDWLTKSLHTAEPAVSVQEMANYLGVSRNTVGNYLAGRTPIDEGRLRLWAMRTGVPLEYLETGIIPDDSDGEPTEAVSLSLRVRRSAD